jgi:acetyl esterase/lipase
MKKSRQIIIVLWMLLSFVPVVVAQGLPGAVVYSVPGMDKAVVRPNIVYKKDGTSEMKLDVYLPPNLTANERRPVVFFVHGGPLGVNPSPGAKDWLLFKSYGRLMAAKGLVGVVLDHRYVSSKAKDLETSFSDVEAAIAFIRAHAAANHVDPDRVALWVFSGAGPHLSIGLRGNTPYIRCLISYYGVLDVGNHALGSGEPPQSMEKYSPIAYLQKSNGSLPSVLIAHAGLDRVAGTSAAVDLFVAKMLAIGGDINLLVHPFGLHGFDAIDKDDQSKDILAATIAFLKGRLSRTDAFEKKKAFLALMRGGNIEAAREFVRTKLNSSGDKAFTAALLSEDQFNNVAMFLSSNKYASAVKQVYEWLIELHPASFVGHSRLAYIYSMARQNDKAVTAARKALSLLNTDTTMNDEQKKTVHLQLESLIQIHQTPLSDTAR